MANLQGFRIGHRRDGPFCNAAYHSWDIRCRVSGRTVTRSDANPGPPVPYLWARRICSKVMQTVLEELVYQVKSALSARAGCWFRIRTINVSTRAELYMSRIPLHITSMRSPSSLH